MQRLPSKFSEIDLFTSAFKYAAIGMAIVDTSGRWLKVNQSLCSLVEYPEQELTELTFQDITHPDDLAEDLRNAQLLLEGKTESYQIEKRYITKTGSAVCIILSVSLIRDPDGNPAFFISQIQDITRLKSYEEELKKLISEDHLTGIGNRRYFYDQSERELKRAARTRSPTSILMVDIDHFKKINDTYGHKTGDEILKSMSITIKHSIRSIDILGRVGGEEFAILLPETNSAESYIIAERLRLSIQTCHERTSIPTPVTVSIGIHTFFSNEESLDKLMQKADKALYQAKSLGRNRTEVYFDAEDNAVTNSRWLSTGTSHHNNFFSLTWDKSLESGNLDIDSQHLSLFEDSNNLLLCMIEDQNSKKCQELLNELVDHVAAHFHSEELILEQANYIHLESHANIHRLLTKRLLKLKDGINENENALGDIFRFLSVDVILNHLIHEDRKFFPVLTRTAKT